MLPLTAKTNLNAILMGKIQLCVCTMHSGYSGWKDYCKGTLKREDFDLGTASSQTYAFDCVYGGSNCEEALVVGKNIGAYAITKAKNGGID